MKPAETVLLDETDGPLSHVQKKKQDKKEKVQRKEEVRKTDEEQEKKPLSFRERIRVFRLLSGSAIWIRSLSETAGLFRLFLLWNVTAKFTAEELVI